MMIGRNSKRRTETKAVKEINREGATMFQNLFSLMQMQMLLEPLCKCYS